MKNRRSSPYLMLGVPFGSTGETAARGFARAVRRIRQSEQAPFDIEDLNWAQHEIDHRDESSEHSLDDFRVPADPSAYKVTVKTHSSAVAPTPLSRVTPPTDPAFKENLKAQVMANAIRVAIRKALTQSQIEELPASFTMSFTASEETK